MKYQKKIEVITSGNITFERNGILHTSGDIETNKELDSITPLIKNNLKELLDENFISSKEIKRIVITLNKINDL